MCLLSFLPSGTLPDLDALHAGAQAHPHGHGWAIATDTGILSGHGMHPREVLDEFATLRARHRGGPALFHSRWASYGPVELGNCHPFPLGGDPRTVLAHNGSLPQRVRPGPYDRRCDTRIAAEDYLPRAPFGSLDTFRGFRGLETWLGPGKMVILTVDPAYARTAYLLGEDRGLWDHGIWYSNTSYRYRTRRSPTLDTVEGACRYCGHHGGPAPIDRYCPDCGWCQRCRVPLTHPQYHIAVLTLRASHHRALPTVSHR